MIENTLGDDESGLLPLLVFALYTKVDDKGVRVESFPATAFLN